MRRALRNALLLTFPVLFGVGCNDDDSPTAPRRDTLTLRSIMPARATLLSRGQTTHFAAVLQYEFATSPRGRLIVTVLESWRSNLFDIRVETLGQLDSRTGEVSVSVDVAIPATAAGGTLDLTFSIIPEGASEPSASAAASYGVASQRLQLELA